MSNLKTNSSIKVGSLIMLNSRRYAQIIIADIATSNHRKTIEDIKKLYPYGVKNDILLGTLYILLMKGQLQTVHDDVTYYALTNKSYEVFEKPIIKLLKTITNNQTIAAAFGAAFGAVIATYFINLIK